MRPVPRIISQMLYDLSHTLVVPIKKHAGAENILPPAPLQPFPYHERFGFRMAHLTVENMEVDLPSKLCGRLGLAARTQTTLVRAAIGGVAGGPPV